jgi:hypothetical protein
MISPDDFIGIGYSIVHTINPEERVPVTDVDQLIQCSNKDIHHNDKDLLDTLS